VSAEDGQIGEIVLLLVGLLALRPVFVIAHCREHLVTAVPDHQLDLAPHHRALQWMEAGRTGIARVPLDSKRGLVLIPFHKMVATLVHQPTVLHNLAGMGHV